MLGEIEGVSASLTPGLARATGTSKTATPCTSAPAPASTGVMQSTVGAWGPPDLRARASPATREPCGQEFDTVRVADANGTREIPTPDDLPLAAARSAARRSAHHRLRQPARVRHRHRRRTRACARRSATSSKAAPVPADPPPATFADGLAAHAGPRRDPPFRPRATRGSTALAEHAQRYRRRLDSSALIDGSRPTLAARRADVRDEQREERADRHDRRPRTTAPGRAPSTTDCSQRVRERGRLRSRVVRGPGT